VLGRTKALNFQHTDLIRTYLNSVHLFVLRPIVEVEVAHSPDVKFYLVSSSPIYKDGNYCISVDPRASGLNLKDVVQNSHGDYCFSHKLLQ
jgi:hypothetical protein